MSTSPTRPEGARGSHLIGRAEELSSLRAIAKASVDDGAKLVLLSGEAGIGKSDLVSELLAQLREAGWQGFVGHCVEHAERLLPFGPIVSLLRSLLGDFDEVAVEEIVGHHRADLASLLPQLGNDVTRGASLAGDVDRLFDAISTTLIRASYRKPLALVVEDIQWSDAATRDFLSSLVRSLGEAGVLLVVTERSGSIQRGHPLRTWLAELRRLPNVTTLALAGLSRQELVELATSVLGRVPSHALIDDLDRRTGGNPYFASELLIAKRDGIEALPSSLADFLTSRTERLSDDERAVLQAVAVAGGTIGHASLSRMLPDIAIGPIVRGLYEASILIVSGNDYSFWHALLRDAILIDLLPFEAEDLHRRAAEAIEEEVSADLSPSDLARLALHWGHSNDPVRSLEAAVAAADASAGVAAYDTAADLALQALRAWPLVEHAEDTAGRSRDRLLVEAADWLAECSRGSEAIELISEALADWAKDLSAGRRALLLAQLAPIEFDIGNPTKATELLTEAARFVVDEVSPEAAMVHHRISKQAIADTHVHPALDAANRAIAIASSHGPQVVLIEALTTKALAIGVTQSLDEGVVLARQARELAVAEGLVSAAAQTYRAELLTIEFRDGRTEACLDATKQGLDYVDRHCGPLWRARMRYDLCEGYVEAGRLSEAQPLLDQLLSMTVDDLRRLEVLQIAGHHGLRTGSLDAAATFLAEAAQIANRYQSAQETGHQHRLIAELARRQSRLDDAIELIDHALKLQADSDNLSLTRQSIVEKARIVKACVELDRAGTAQMLSDVTELAQVFDGPGTANAAYRSLMDLELTSIHQPVDREGVAATVGLLETAGYRYEAALARLLLIEELIRSRSDRPLLESEAQDVHRVARDLGMIWVADKMVSLAKRARIDLRAGEPPESSEPAAIERYPHHLTEREVEVLSLLAEGLTNKAIAERLYVSPRTVSTHVSNVLAKLGVSNRAEAGAAYHRLDFAALTDAAGES